MKRFVTAVMTVGLVLGVSGAFANVQQDVAQTQEINSKMDEVEKYIAKIEANLHESAQTEKAQSAEKNIVKNDNPF